MVLWVGQAGLSWVILLLYVTLTEGTHWYLSGLWSGLEDPKWLYSHAWMVGRPGLVVPNFPRSVRTSSCGLSARVVGLLTCQLKTPRVIALGEEVGLTNRCSITLFFFL